jgi:hypothetical protein
MRMSSFPKIIGSGSEGGPKRRETRRKRWTPTNPHRSSIIRSPSSPPDLPRCDLAGCTCFTSQGQVLPPSTPPPHSQYSYLLNFPQGPKLGWKISYMLSNACGQGLNPSHLELN